QLRPCQSVSLSTGHPCTLSAAVPWELLLRDPAHCPWLRVPGSCLLLSVPTVCTDHPCSELSPAVCTDHPCPELSLLCALTTCVLNCPRCVHRPPVF
ncbi:unnamed protein product, partial [Staurois parvus]